MRSLWFSVVCVWYSAGAAVTFATLWSAGYKSQAGFLAMSALLVVIDLIADWMRMPSRWKRQK